MLLSRPHPKHSLLRGAPDLRRGVPDILPPEFQRIVLDREGPPSPALNEVSTNETPTSTTADDAVEDAELELVPPPGLFCVEVPFYEFGNAQLPRLELAPLPTSSSNNLGVVGSAPMGKFYHQEAGVLPHVKRERLVDARTRQFAHRSPPPPPPPPLPLPSQPPQVMLTQSSSSHYSRAHHVHSFPPQQQQQHRRGGGRSAQPNFPISQHEQGRWRNRSPPAPPPPMPYHASSHEHRHHQPRRNVIVVDEHEYYGGGGAGAPPPPPPPPLPPTAAPGRNRSSLRY